MVMEPPNDHLAAVAYRTITLVWVRQIGYGL
jgi:hypothetical protein